MRAKAWTFASALLIALGLCSVLALDARAKAPVADAFDLARRMGRGVNILGYDPIWSDPSRARFKMAYFAKIRAGGFRTVRINLQAFAHMDGANLLDAGWLHTLDQVVAGALEAHLVVILDEHDFNACSEAPAPCLAKLEAFWQQLATRYRKAGSDVLFELENEPHDPLTPDLWNDFVATLLRLVRQTNPTRTVVVGPGSYNDGRLLDALQIPEDDRNILVTVHYYRPMAFTHQGAPWSKETVGLSGVTWGTPADRDRLSAEFDAIQDWAGKHRRPILLGEFGAYEKAPMPSRLAYDSAVARAAERRGWPWCYWQFDSDFIVFDVAKDDWVVPIWRALVPLRDPSPAVRGAAGRRGSVVMGGARDN